MKISVADSRFVRKWNNTQISWDDLVERLKEPKRTSETIAEYLAMTKTQQANVKDVGGFVGGHLVDGRRGKGRVESRSMIALDMDFAKPDTWLTLLEEMQWKGLAYSTHKHTAEKPRMRLVLPLAREISEEEYAPIGRAIAKQIGMDLFDDISYEAHRLMYWPSAASDGEYVMQQYDGPVLDPDEVLGGYEDWRDVQSWPLSSRETALPLPRGKKQEDPLTKTGLIGAFCRTYTLTEAIETFLKDFYTQGKNDERWTFKAGEAVGGVVVYDDKFAYSHHGTDPAGGQLLNAFDLVRIHKFGELDADTKPETPVNRLPSYAAMSDFAKDDALVKELLAAERLSSATQEFSVITPDWQKKLTIDRKGKVEATLPNLALILENDPELSGIAFDELWDAIAVRDLLPWPRPPEPWRDTDDAHLALYIEKRYGRFTARDLDTALTAVADSRKFHPVLDYLADLPEWDGARRVDTLLVDYLGADDSPYVQAVTRKLLCAAVRRVRQPGCKFDTMLILVGPQGVGKSTLAARLGGEWFNDSLSLSDTRDKTAAEKLQGFWIQEFGEMAGMRKADVETLRSFISRQDDIYRGAYAKRVSRHPRQSVFIGTTNAESGFLTDPAGNRRMWPVNTPGGGAKKPWDLSEAEVAQIWAETLVHEAAGEKLYLEGDVAIEAGERQRDAIEVDERTGIVAEYLDRRLPENWQEMGTFERRNYLEGSEFGEGPSDGSVVRTEVSVVEIWCECFGKPKADLNRRESYAITNILRRLGWESSRRTSRVRPYGKQMIFENLESKVESE